VLVLHVVRMGGERSMPRAVAAVYAEARGRAMAMGMVRLRWHLRRLPAHSCDERVMARVKALRDELRVRERTSL
jgi:hypothetical protein